MSPRAFHPVILATFAFALTTPHTCLAADGCLARSLLKDPALRELRREQKRSEKQSKRLLKQAFLGEEQSEDDWIREAFKKGNPLSRPENRVQSIEVQYSFHVPFGSYDARKIGKNPLDWELVRESETANGTKKLLTAKNKVTGEQKAVQFNWDPAWEERDQFFSEFPLKVELTGEKSLKETTPHFDERMKEPDFKLYHDRVIESRDAYEGGARQSRSLAIDLLLHQSASLEAKDPRLPQYLWVLAQNNEEAGRFFAKRATAEPFRQTSLRPFFLGPYSANFSLTAPSSLTAPIDFTRYKGIEAFTVRASALESADDVEHALRLMSSFTYWKQTSRAFEPGTGLESVIQAVSIEGRAGKPGIQVHYFDYPELLALEERNKSSVARFKVKRPPWRPPVQYRHAPEDIRRYVMRGYQEELGLSKNQLKEPFRISRKTAHRTRYVFISEQPYAYTTTTLQKRVHPLAGEMEWPVTKFRDFEHFKIRGAMSIVESKGSHEPLPMESYLGIQLERKTNKPIVELGRFYVDPELRPVGPQSIWQVAYSVLSNQPLEKVVAHTDKAYAEQLIAKFGFKKVSEKINPRGKMDFVIEATPEDIFRVAVKGRAAPVP